MTKFSDSHTKMANGGFSGLGFLSKLMLFVFVVMALLWLLDRIFDQQLESSWEGIWRTQWQGGGAEMLLKRDGNQVVGSYQPHSGIIIGTIKGNLMEGTWQQADASGNVVFDLAPDGQSFFGRYDNGEWWNGAKVSGATDFAQYSLDLTSPQSITRQYLSAFNGIHSGRYFRAYQVLEGLDFGEGESSDSERFTRALKYFYLLDQFLVDISAIAKQPDEELYTYNLDSPRLSDEISLRFRRHQDKWLIVVPDTFEVDAFFQQHHINYAKLQSDNTSFYSMQTPRDTMRAFVETMNGRVVDGFHISDTFVKTSTEHDFQSEIVAQYLKHTLDKIAEVIYQEIPDNTDREIPYVFFNHPIGDISLVPVKNEDGVTQWKFSKSTLDQIRKLYNTFDDIPVVAQVDVRSEPILLFQIRSYIYRIAPILVESTLGIENWQWLFFPLIMLLSVLLARLCRYVPRLFAVRLSKGRITDQEANEFAVPLIIMVLSALWVYVFAVLGADKLLTEVVTSSGLILIAFSGLRFTFLAANTFRRLVLDANAAFQANNKIYATLLISIIKVMIGFVAFFICSSAIGVSMDTIVAGLGIFGLAIAFAARETIGNIFGSMIVILDRPFIAGDFVKVGDLQGEVESVGIRSTRIRTRDDTLMVIPNGVFSRESVENITEKSCRHGELNFHVPSFNDIDALQQALIEVKECLLADDRILANPFVGIVDLDDDGVKVSIHYRAGIIDPSGYSSHRNQLLIDLVTVFKQHEIRLNKAIRQIVDSDPD